MCVYIYIYIYIHKKCRSPAFFVFEDRQWLRSRLSARLWGELKVAAAFYCVDNHCFLNYQLFCVT